MNQSITLRVLATTMLSCALAAPTVYAESDSDKANHTISVRVTNTNANPVPVNGNVVVSGTANVNVTNPVTIANPVNTVTVGNTTPIPVTVTGLSPVPTAENPARSPAVIYAKTTFTGPSGALSLDTAFIPTGSRFVMEVASLYCLSPQDSVPILATLTVPRNNVYAHFAIPLNYQGTIQAQAVVWHAGNINGNIYIDSGSPDTLLSIERSNSTGGSSCHISLSGYLVTL